MGASSLNSGLGDYERAGRSSDGRWFAAAEHPEERHMIKVSVLYPNHAASRFDMGYYLNKHMPMVQQKLGSALRGSSVEQGLGGMQPGSPPASAHNPGQRGEAVGQGDVAEDEHPSVQTRAAQR